MRAKSVYESSFERGGNPHRSLSIGLRENPRAFFLALLPLLVDALHSRDLKFIEFEQIPITDLTELTIKYQSPLATSKYMAARIWPGRGGDKADYSITFDIGKYSGGTSFADWNPSYNVAEDVKDIIDAMSLWGWWQLPVSMQKANPKPSSAIWASSKEN